MKKLLLTFLLSITFHVCFAQVNTEVKQFFSEGLNQNRTVYIYRPDSTVYTEPLPVMIWLSGKGQAPNGTPQLRSKMENLINSGQIEPMLIIIPDGRDGVFHNSNSYWNSPGVNGYYGDYIAIETVNFVKQNYNVIQDSGKVHAREAFIISGSSMGGGGATRVGYKWGNVFSGIAAFSGDIDHRRIFDSYIINTINSQARHDSLNNIIYTPPDPSLGFEYAFWGYASAFSPDTTAQYLCQFPLREGDGSIIDSVRTKWLEAGPVHTATIHYQSYDQSSMKLFFAVDPNDPLYAGTMTQSFVDWINQNYPQVPLTNHLHNYGHSLPSTLVDSMLIWADAHFKNITTGMDDFNYNNIKNYELFQNFPNPFTTSTTLSYELQQPSPVQLSVFNQLGQLVYQHSEEQRQGSQQLQWQAVDQPEGLYYYQLKVGDQVVNGKLVKVR